MKYMFLQFLQSKGPTGGEPLFATPCCNTSRATWSTPSEPPHKKPFFEVLSFSALFGTGCCCQLVLNLGCLISVCPCIPETGRLENTYSCCCGFWLWSWLAANLFVLNLLRFISVCLYPKRVRTEMKQKRPCPAVQGTWLHVGPFLAGVLTQRFLKQPLELYILRLSRCILSRSSPAPGLSFSSLCRMLRRSRCAQIFIFNVIFLYTILHCTVVRNS